MGPTDRQARLIKHFAQYGAPSPTTRAACSTLIAYLCHGQYSQLATCSARLAFFRKWTGAVVRITRINHPYHKCLGKVVGWRMRPQDEIIQLITAPRRTNNPLPFMALVKLDRVVRPIAFSLSDLKVVTHGQQTLLFDLT